MWQLPDGRPSAEQENVIEPIATTSPIANRRWLARELRARRETTQLDQGDVAGQLDWSEAKMSYIETAAREVRYTDLMALLHLYAVGDDDAQIYVEAWRRSREKGWWRAYDEEIIPSWLANYLGLEDAASSLRGFAMQLVPGLLQTSDYATAIMTEVGSGMPPEDAAARTEVRLRRQQVLTRQPDPLEVHYVLDEAALRRVVGGHAVMRGQLAHLVELSELANVTVQVLTFEQGAHFDGMGEPIVLSFPWAATGVVYIEGLRRGETLEARHHVQDHEQAFRRSSRAALSAVESRSLIVNLAEDHREP